MSMLAYFSALNYIDTEKFTLMALKRLYEPQRESESHYMT